MSEVIKKYQLSIQEDGREYYLALMDEWTVINNINLKVDKFTPNSSIHIGSIRIIDADYKPIISTPLRIIISTKDFLPLLCLPFPLEKPSKLLLNFEITKRSVEPVTLFCNVIGEIK